MLTRRLCPSILREPHTHLVGVGRAHDRRSNRLVERLLCDQPDDWRPYYSGSDAEQHIARHFSYSDRIRYYWPLPRARETVDRLLTELRDVALPETLISQYLPRLYERVRNGELSTEPRSLVAQSVRDVLRNYAAACQ